MQLKRFIGTVMAGLAYTSAAADVAITDPEIDFIKIPESVRADWGMLPKPEIKRLDLDLTGDGEATVFLAYNGVGSKAGTEWTAYHPTKGGYVRTHGLQFREDFLRAGKMAQYNPEGGLMLLYPGKGAGLLCRIIIEPTGRLASEEIMDLDYANPNHQELFEQVFGRKLGEPMPAAYFKNPPHQVIEVKAIEARAASQSKVGTTATNQPPPKASPPLPVQPSASTKAPETKPTPSATSEDLTSSTPWSIIVLLIIAACGLLWLLLKRRS